MTLNIIHSNKPENLHNELCALLKNTPQPNPFQAETIVCPSQAMSRWVHMRLTQKMGIAAHYDYPMPSSWVWQLATNLLDDVPEQDPLQRDSMAWRIFHLLNELQQKQSFEAIKNYLNNDADTTKRWSIAKKIAWVFERYQHFRPTMIKEWNAGQADEWQAELWQQLTQALPTNRVTLLELLGKQLYQAPATEKMPMRAIFFSLSALPPLLFKNIQALAQHIDVYFFVLSPSAHYWSDVISLKQQAKQRLNKPEISDYYNAGHELLASWGRQGQVFQDMLIAETDDALTEQYDVYDEHFNASLLQQLQRSLYALDEAEQSIEVDQSIRINRCHSPLRECEVLHDQCLSLLQQPDLTPEDILVMVPNMEEYAATIEVVFKKTPDQKQHKPFIPWNLSDTSLRSENTLIRTFLNLLALPSSRFTVTEILAYLECPATLKRFGLVEADKAIIREYYQQGHVNWGFSAAHKGEFNVPELSQNTWQQAQQRFFTAYAIDAENAVGHVQPLAGFSSSRALVIAQFMHLLERLNHWRKALRYARSMAQWQSDLNLCIQAFFAESNDDGLQAIRDAIDELVSQATELKANQETPVHRALVQQWLGDYFDQAQNSQRFFSGGITFCGMRPMRSVPFKVVVMLGMNEHDFPRQHKPIEFDLMAQQWQQGDLLSSDEDRYLFLEALLCTRQTLIISYCAYSIKDNAPKEPSSLVSELCDYLDSQFKPKQTSQKSVTELIAKGYAMHAFSPKNYSGDEPSYNQFWYGITQQMQQKSTLVVGEKSAHKAEQETMKTIELDRFIRCLKDPISCYYQNQLNIRLYDESEAEDDEPFDLDALQKWQIKDALIKAALQNKETSFQQTESLAVLPHGNHAQSCFNALAEEATTLLDGYANYLKTKVKSLSINCSFNEGVNIKGNINHYYSGLGLLFITASKFGAKPLLESWISHCALCVTKQLKSGETTVLQCKDKRITFHLIAAEKAQTLLQQLLDVWQQSQQQPLLLLPKTSFAYQYNLVENDDSKAKIEALKHWKGSSNNNAIEGEREQSYVRHEWPHYYSDASSLMNSPEFIALANQLYAPILKHVVSDEVQA